MKTDDWIIHRVARRPPDFIIGGMVRPYLLRWWVIPRNRVYNMYLHCFKRSDDDRARHTHPWLFNISWILRGQYREWYGDGPNDYVDRRAGSIKFRLGAAPHRVELTHGDCWTLFITGPRVREWGFLCGARFVHWKLFTGADSGRPGEIGRGCAE
jgi:hypothetical protein